MRYITPRVLFCTCWLLWFWIFENAVCPDIEGRFLQDYSSLTTSIFMRLMHLDTRSLVAGGCNLGFLSTTSRGYVARAPSNFRWLPLDVLPKENLPDARRPTDMAAPCRMLLVLHVVHQPLTRHGRMSLKIGGSSCQVWITGVLLLRASFLAL